MGENGFNGVSTASAPMSEVFVAMPLLQQSGEVFVGPGAKKDAQLIGLGLSKLSSRRKDDLHAAKRYAMDLSIKQIMLRQQKAHQENQQKQAMYAQALSLMSRVYIGSISFEVREDMLKKSFEAFGPIKSINMSFDPSTGHHKGFAFLEYDVPEAALLAQDSMNGQLMGGRNLKVGRPSNMPQAQPIIEMVQHDAKKYYRVYVASVHPDLSESDLKSVFEAFGEVVRCQLARQSASGRGTHRGFGYIEFNNASAMHEAISGMNMFDLGGQFLRVGRCITPPEALQYLQPASQTAIPAAAAVAAAAVTAKVMAAEASGSPKPGSKASDSPRSESPAPTKTTSVKTEVKAEPRSESRGASPAQTEQLQIQGSPTVVKAEPIEVKSEIPDTSSEGGQSAISEPKFGSIPPPGIAPPPGVLQLPPPPPPGIVAPPGLIQPPGLVVPTTTSQPEVDTNGSAVSKSRFGGFAVDVPPPTSVELPGNEASTAEPAAPPPPKKKKKNRGERSFTEKLNAILDKQKAKTDALAEGDGQFGALDAHLAPKDPSEEDKEEQLAQLAITGSVQSMALAIIGDGALVAAGKLKQLDPSAPAQSEGKKRRGGGRVYEPKKIEPKLNTAQQLAAAQIAGELSDTVRNEQASNEDATLASQEGLVQIRGRDSRHLLMQKLMRTNRSCILVLRNMVGPEDIDEYLEEEIKEECNKYGEVNEVIIVNDESTHSVKIFVRFTDPKEVDGAIRKLDCRFFGGRTVKAEVYDQALFDHGDFSS